MRKLHRKECADFANKVLDKVDHEEVRVACQAFLESLAI
jgi:hypothetical protein